MTEEKIKLISEAVSGMTRADWARVVTAIEKKFDAENAKVTLTDSASIERAIRLEL